MSTAYAGFAFSLAVWQALDPSQALNVTCTTWTPELRVWIGGVLMLACVAGYPAGAQPSWSAAADACKAAGGHLMPLNCDDTVDQLLKFNLSSTVRRTKMAMPIDMLADGQGGFVSAAINQSYADDRGIFRRLAVKMSTFYGNDLRGFLDLNPITKAVKLFVQDEHNAHGIADRFFCLRGFRSRCPSTEVLAIYYMNQYLHMRAIKSDFAVVSPVTLNLMTAIWGDSGSSISSGSLIREFTLADANESLVINPGDRLLLKCSETFHTHLDNQLSAKQQMEVLCNDNGTFGWPAERMLCHHGSPCLYKPCLNGGTCAETPDSFACICQKPFFGTLCENRICDESSISKYWKSGNNGSVLSDPRVRASIHWCAYGDCAVSGACDCWYAAGPNCIYPVDDCWNNPCDNGGLCIDRINAFECICPTGWFGQACRRPDNPCSSNPCRNGGTCNYEMSNLTCRCTGEYFGPTCSDEVVRGQAGILAVSIGVSTFAVMTTSALCVVCTKLRTKDVDYARSVKLANELQSFLHISRLKNLTDQQILLILESMTPRSEAATARRRDGK